MKNATYAQAQLTDAIPAPRFETDKPLPDEIQWMPAGEHLITPDVGGERKEVKMMVDEALANLFSSQLQTLIAIAAEGKGDVPFLDFNHKNEAASAEVLSLHWGGNDPRTGGIRAKVKWSEPGAEALRGRAYRRFSPSWYLDKKTLKPVAIGENLGGLVNMAAFRNIAPVGASQEGSPSNQQQQTQMTTEQEKQLAQLPDILAGVKTLTESVQALTSKVGSLETKASGLDAISNRLTTLEGANQGAVVANAKAIVAAAVKAGRLAPQDTESHTFWEGLITANAAAAKQLEKLPVNPAFLTVTKASGSGEKTLTETEQCLAAKGQ